MEPIPQLILTDPEEHILLARRPNGFAATLADDADGLAQLRQTCPEVPDGLRLTCPPVPVEEDPHRTEPYIALCRETFRDALRSGADFFYLHGAESFRALRAAVLAVTDRSSAPLMAELAIESDGRMEDGTDVVAAVGVLQKIGVSAVVLTASAPEELTEAFERVAPHARLSLGARVPHGWLAGELTLPACELVLAAEDEPLRLLAGRLNALHTPAVSREVDGLLLAPDGRDAHFIDYTTDISDEIACDHLLGQRLIDLEDEEPAAFKLLLEEEEDVAALEENLYMISRPVCLCAENPELLERALRVYPGLALYDGTWEQEDRLVKYFGERYGLIRL